MSEREPVARTVEAAEARRTERFDVLAEIGAAFESIPADELEHEVARALSDVRAEHRARHGATVR